jgi:hypothetical protein
LSAKVRDSWIYLNSLGHHANLLQKIFGGEMSNALRPAKLLEAPNNLSLLLSKCGMAAQ